MTEHDEHRLVERARRFLAQREDVRRVRKWSLLVVAACIGVLAFVQVPPVIAKLNSSANPGDFLVGVGIGFSLALQVILVASFFTLMIFTLFKRAEGTWPLQELLVKYHDQLHPLPGSSSVHSSAPSSNI